jgi:hypothetical protein
VNEYWSPSKQNGYTQCKTYYTRCPHIVDGFKDYYEYSHPHIAKGCEVVTSKTSTYTFSLRNISAQYDPWIVKKADGSNDCRDIEITCDLASTFRHEFKYSSSQKMNEIIIKPCDANFYRAQYDNPAGIWSSTDYNLDPNVKFPATITRTNRAGQRNLFAESYPESLTLDQITARIQAEYQSMKIENIKITQETTTSKGFKATPENFLNLQDRLVPGRNVTWHAIVNINGNRCAGDGEDTGTVSKGTDYIQLADMTGGIVEDICAPKFDGFLQSLGQKVITEIDKSYDLSALSGEADFTNWRVVEVKRRETTLKSGTDYTATGATIRFAPKAIGKGDVFTVVIGKP